jgi:hypothetical protein
MLLNSCRGYGIVDERLLGCFVVGKATSKPAQFSTFFSFCDGHHLAHNNVVTCASLSVCALKVHKTTMDQVCCMLTMLKKCDDIYFEPFCKALEDLGQKEVARRLRNNQSLSPLSGQFLLECIQLL